MADMSDVLEVLTSIENYLIDLPTKILLKADQIYIVNGLSDVSENLGIVTAGEFRAGNRLDPGKLFTGMRMAYPALTYDLDGTPTDFHLVGVNADVLQFGVNAADGTLVAGAGAVVLSATGIVATAGTIAGWTINSDNLSSPGTPGIIISSAGSIETSNFVSGITGVGWKISEDGDVEFNNAVVRGELRTTVLTYQEVQAVSGTMGVFQSSGVILEATGAVPAVASSMNIKIKDPEYGHTQLFAVNDVIWIKDGTNATWLTVTTVTDNTTYYTYACTVESGSTGNVYTAGQAVVNFGQSGAGYLLMEAIGTDAPYFSVRTRGASPWSANTEHVRMGNLDGNWGYSSESYGVGIGQYAAGKSNIVIDDTGVLAINSGTTNRINLTSAGILTIKNSSGNAVFTFDASAGAEFTLPLTLATTGGIYQGTGTFASPTTGLKIWNDGGVGRIGGYNSGTVQWYADTDGKLYAGGGKIIIDSIGIRLQTITQPFWPQANDSAVIRFYEGANTLSSIYEYRVTSPRTYEQLILSKEVESSGYAGKSVDLIVRTSDTTEIASVSVGKRIYPSGFTGVTISSTVGSDTSYITVGATGITMYNNVTFINNLISYKNSTAYTGYIFVPLTTPLTSTSYDGGDTVSVGTTSIDTSSVFSAPAGIKGVMIQISGVWSSANNGYTASLRPKGGSTNVMVIRAQIANINSDMTGFCPCDSNGDLDLVVAGADMSNTVLRIHGYFI